MGKPLVISIPHTLGKGEAVRRLQSGIARVTSEIPFVKVEGQTWRGNRMSFGVSALGQTSSGTIDVSEDLIRVEISLPILLQKFAAAIQGGLSRGTQRLLEKK